jgi:hypothetical protein
MNSLALIFQSKSNVQATIIAYPPSGGGNHLKNLLCLSDAFANSSDLNLEPYNTGNREVHSTSGRNMNQYRMADALSSSGDFILHGHFGELAPFRETINSIQYKRFVIVNIDTQQDRQVLQTRQKRLGQQSHDYYLHEEQYFLYQSQMYSTYFTGQECDIFSFPLTDLWHSAINYNGTWDRLNSFLGINIDLAQAQRLHDQWRANNQMSSYYF